MPFKILSIEDDLTIQALIEQSLKDCDIVTSANLHDAEKELSKTIFDAVLIDIELPDGDGLKFYTRMIHDKNLKEIPTLFISSHDDISNKLIAFSFGAEDFITKPFNPLELNARVSSKIKKKQNELDDKKIRKVGDLKIDFNRQNVFQNIKGKENSLDLTSIEFKILTLLTNRSEQIYSREQILDSVWGNTAITDRTVDSHIAHLRTKISNSSVIIETVKNFGYRFILR